MVVPVNQIARYVTYIKSIAGDYSFEVKSFGHAGAGKTTAVGDSPAQSAITLRCSFIARLPQPLKSRPKKPLRTA